MIDEILDFFGFIFTLVLGIAFFLGLIFGILFLGGWIYEQITEKPTINSLQIYIAGKYSGNVTYNVQQAELAGMQVADKCNYPLVPHLLGYMSKEQHNYTYWTTLDDIGLEKSDGLLLISHSAGADAELKLAQHLGKPIYYSIDEVPNRCK